jgi:hypothetical protein
MQKNYRRATLKSGQACSGATSHALSNDTLSHLRLHGFGSGQVLIGTITVGNRLKELREFLSLTAEGPPAYGSHMWKWS